MNNIVESIIEIPMGTKNKFEVNKKTGKIKLDRVLYSALTYPGEYGYIDETLSGDGDPLDVLIISNYPTFPGCVVDARVIGYLKVIDNDMEDEKVIAVVDKDPRFNQMMDIKDVPEFKLIEIKDFFQNYKNLQNIEVKADDFYPLQDALAIIEDAKKRYKEINSK
jgi:inorganic pyrophosphatase